MTTDPIKAKIQSLCPDVVMADKGFKNAVGTWQYAYTDDEGKNRHSKSFETHKEAHEAAVRSGLYPTKDITLAVVLRAIDKVWPDEKYGCTS